MVAAGLSVYQYIENIKKEKESNELQLKVIETQEELISSQKQSEKTAIENSLKLENVNEHLRLKTEELLEAQAKVIELQNESLKNIIGHGFTEVHLNQLDANSFRFYIKSKSDYNIFNILIEVINFDEIKKCNSKFENNTYYFSESCLQKNSHRDTMKSLNPNSYADLSAKYTLNKKEIHFIIKIISDNITTMQYSKIVYNKSGKLTHLFRIFEVKRDNNTYVLLNESNEKQSEDEWIDNFPYKLDMKIL